MPRLRHWQKGFKYYLSPRGLVSRMESWCVVGQRLKDASPQTLISYFTSSPYGQEIHYYHPEYLKFYLLYISRIFSWRTGHGLIVLDAPVDAGISDSTSIAKRASCDAIRLRRRSFYLHIPQAGFLVLFGRPLCARSVFTIHVPICAPQPGPRDGKPVLASASRSQRSNNCAIKD